MHVAMVGRMYGLGGTCTWYLDHQRPSLRHVIGRNIEWACMS
jgi:hypothetical protein